MKKNEFMIFAKMIGEADALISKENNFNFNYAYDYLKMHWDGTEEEFNSFANEAISEYVKAFN